MRALVLLCLVSAAVSLPTGVVGPSGSIGPSGMIGPTGPVQFHTPAYAFFGHNAHAHVAALNTHRFASAPAPATQYQAAPVVGVFGVDAAGCVNGPSGRVCPTGNVQYI